MYTLVNLYSYEDTSQANQISTSSPRNILRYADMTATILRTVVAKSPSAHDHP